MRSVGLQPGDLCVFETRVLICLYTAPLFSPNGADGWHRFLGPVDGTVLYTRRSIMTQLEVELAQEDEMLYHGRIRLIQPVEQCV